jgi:hypothetical protein
LASGRRNQTASYLYLQQQLTSEEELSPYPRPRPVSELRVESLPLLRPRLTPLNVGSDVVLWRLAEGAAYPLLFSSPITPVRGRISQVISTSHTAGRAIGTRVGELPKDAQPKLFPCPPSKSTSKPKGTPLGSLFLDPLACWCAHHETPRLNLDQDGLPMWSQGCRIVPLRRGQPHCHPPYPQEMI